MMTLRALLLAGTAGLLLSGCEYIQPSDEDTATNLALAETAALEGISLAISRPSVPVGAGFRKATAQAALSHPGTRAAQNAILRGDYAIDEVRGALEPQISGRLYAGLSDEANETVGAAARLNFSQVLYDGGDIASQITAAKLDQHIAYETYRQALNENLLDAAQTWVSLREATRLSALTQDRLEVVRPLFNQVETVAQSGVVDRSIVSSARRLVNDVRAAEVDTKDQLRQARTAFRRTFGKLPGSSSYNADFVSARTQGKVGESHILIAPQVVSQFLRYQQSLANLETAKAQDRTRLSLEADINEPLGDTTEEGSRTAGLVISRTFYDGKRTQARINQASVRVVEARDTLQAAYREQGRAVFGFKESLESVVSSIALARDARAIARDEVETFRQQLSIGQSSLEGVLQAEVRLYRAEAELISLEAAKTNLELNLLASLGRLPEAFGIREADALNQFLTAYVAE